MSILLVGDVYSVFLDQLVRELRKYGYTDKIDGLMLNPPAKRLPSAVDNCYCYDAPARRNRIFNILLLPFKLYKAFKLVRSIGHYDVVNIHFVQPYLPIFWKEIKKKAGKTVLSVWGSDFYRAGNRARKKLYKIFKECDAITFTNEQSRQDFIKYYNDFERKSRVCSFGLETLEIIKSIENQKNKPRKIFDIPDDKIIISCGYASATGQQHEKIINIIKELDASIRGKCLFIFPMTYGDMIYRKKIEQKLIKSGIDYLVLKDFMSYEEIARLRLITDIMIHIPVSDQFSGSMQEILFCGNIVITGDWLPYKILNDKGVFLLSIDSEEKLLETLVYALDNLKELKNRAHPNRDIIWNLSSWKVNAGKWYELYNSI